MGRISKPLEGYGLQCTSFIMLGDEEEKEAQAVLRLLDVLFTSEKEVAERKRILEEEFHIPMNDNIEKEMDHMCNLSKGVENRGIRTAILNVSFTCHMPDCLEMPYQLQCVERRWAMRALTSIALEETPA